MVHVTNILRTSRITVNTGHVLKFYMPVLNIAIVPVEARENALPWKILHTSLCCQIPEIFCSLYSALLLLAIESLTIYLGQYFSTTATELQGIFFSRLPQDPRNSLRRLLLRPQTR